MLDTRINRLSFWALMVPCTVLPTALAMIGFEFSGAWIPTAAVCVLRLHDLGRTGKWVLVPLILQFIAAIVLFNIVPRHQISAAAFAITGVTLLVVAWLGSEPGEPVSNAWGGPTAPGFSFGKRA